MADLPGGLLPEDPLAFGSTFRSDTGALEPVDPPSSSLTYRGDAGYATSQGGAVAVTTYYKLRVRDDGVGPPAVYRNWTSTDSASAVPGAPPVGSWVDRTVLDEWTL